MSEKNERFFVTRDFWDGVWSGTFYTLDPPDFYEHFFANRIKTDHRGNGFRQPFISFESIFITIMVLFQNGMLRAKWRQPNAAMVQW